MEPGFRSRRPHGRSPAGYGSLRGQRGARVTRRSCGGSRSHCGGRRRDARCGSGYHRGRCSRPTSAPPRKSPRADRRL